MVFDCDRGYLYPQHHHQAGLLPCRIPPSDLSFLLKKFKNFATDEYSTVDDDGLSVPPLACAFAKMSQHQHILSVVDEDGYLVLYNTHHTAGPAIIKTWQIHSNAVFDLEWMSEENKVFSGSGDQTIALYDVESQQKEEVFKGHASSVKSISCRVGDDAVFASGSRDGHIMTWDKRICHKDGAIPPVNIIHNAHTILQPVVTSKVRRKKQTCQVVRDGQQSVTCVLFQNENYLMSAGAVDGCLKVWDIRKTYHVKKSMCQNQPVHMFHYPGTNSRRHGYSSLSQDSYGLRLFASCTDDIIYEYDIFNYTDTPVRLWSGHRNTSFYVKSSMSPDNEYLLSGSSDNMAYIWQVNKTTAPPIALMSHTSEVTSVAWCPNDSTKLVTLSDDTRIKFWRIYCREQDKSKLPPCLGRARQQSKERGTSTTECHLQDLPTPLNTPLSKPSTALVTEATPPRKSASIKDWLMPKSQSQDNLSHDLSESTEISVCKSPRLEASVPSTVVGSGPDTPNRKRFHFNWESTASLASPAKRPRPGDEEDIQKQSQTPPGASRSGSKPQPLPWTVQPSPLRSQRGVITSPSKSPTRCRLKLTEEENYLSPRKHPETIEVGQNRTTSQNRLCLRNLDTNVSALNTDISLSVRQNLFPDLQYNDNKVCMSSTSKMDQNSVSSTVSSSVNISTTNTSTSVLVLDSQTAGSIYHNGIAQSTPIDTTHSSSVSYVATTPMASAVPPITATDFTMALPSTTVTHFTTVIPPTITTPSKLLNLQADEDFEHDSPTRNLPNLVLDELEGQNMTPPPLKSKLSTPKNNWLTRLQLERLGQVKKEPESAEDRGKSPKMRSPKVTKRMKSIQSYFKKDETPL